MHLQTNKELAQKEIDELATILRSTNACTPSRLSIKEMQDAIISQQ